MEVGGDITMMEEYRTSITQLVNKNKDVPEIQFVVEDPGQFSMKQLTGGSSNIVILVTSQDGGSKFVFKMAPNDVKNFTEIQLTPRRIHVEYHSLMTFNELYPDSAPYVFCLDSQSHAIALEYMEGFEPMTFHMNTQRKVDLEVARRLGEIIGVVHKRTWIKNMPPAEAQRMRERFIIDEITKTKLEFAVICGLDEEWEMKYVEPEALDAFRELKKDGSLSHHIDTMVDMVHNKQQCLVHSDFYPGSVMVKGSDNVRVYDMEFASVTAAGTDPGIMAIYYIMGYVRGIMEGQVHDATRYLAGSQTFLKAYMDQMEDVLLSEEEKKEMVEDIAFISGWYLISMTTFRDAHFHMTLSPEVKIVLWRIGKIFLDRNKELSSVEDYINLFTKHCQELTSA